MRFIPRPTLFVILLCLFTLPAFAQQVDRVNLLSMGDWGSGTRDQKAVAEALANYASASKDKIDGMLLVGDNFYMPLPGGIKDPVWQTVFEKMYDPVKLNFPFYAVLGNHDYKDGKDAIELEYAKANPQSRWKLPARWYRLDIPHENPLVTVLMLDSDRDLMAKDLWTEEAKWIEAELSKPRGTWTLCCAHHPLFTNGGHGDNGPLKSLWGPMFEKYKVDFYIAGHDHDLEHLQLPDKFTTFVVVGGGGAETKLLLRDDRGPMAQLMHGFGNIELTKDLATVRYITEDGKTLHEFTREKSGKVTVTVEGGRGAAVLPLRAIEGFGPFKPSTQPSTQPVGGGD